MEGVASEACSMAGHLGLGKLNVLYDANRITIDGPTDLSFSEDVLGRYRAYGWHTLSVEDGNDVEALDAAFEAALAETGRPSLIQVRTHIGYGSPNKQDSAASHGAPLGADEVSATKEALGLAARARVPGARRGPRGVRAGRGLRVRGGGRVGPVARVLPARVSGGGGRARPPPRRWPAGRLGATPCRAFVPTTARLPPARPPGSR